MKQKTLLEVKDLKLSSAEKKIMNSISFSIKEGERLAIAGPSGSGKSSLIKALAGGHGAGCVNVFSENGHKPHIVTVSHQHQFKNLSNTSSFYYQQRFNSCDSDDAITVNEGLLATGAAQETVNETLDLLGIGTLQFTRLIQLSNGEHKRFQIAKAVLQKADWIFLDSPFTGLDKDARRMLNNILEKLISTGINILLVTSVTNIPQSITHVALLDNGELKEKQARADFEKSNASLLLQHKLPVMNKTHLQEMPPAYRYEDFSVAIKMVDVNVNYSNKKILENINWVVKKGECWNVSGHNGSGKSTLLSLVTGDNPQAFANDIYLFDRRKGSGETIWDIKRKIGYVSPELHHYFDAGSPCFEIVASGLFDTIGLFRQLNEKQKSLVHNWMSLMQIENFEKRMFRQLSNGEQRLVLLTRALIKNPPLLILDEPCQGLDAEVSSWFIDSINDICVSMQKTLVYVSHYEQEIPVCVTKVLKLNHGRIAA